MREHLRSNVVGYLALFVALGGSAFAAATIGSGDIKRNAVQSRHIAADAVKRAELANGAVGSAELAQDSVGGQHVSQGSLEAGDLSPAARAELSYAKQGRQDVAVPIADPPGSTLVAAMDIPAGSWLILARVQLTSSANAGNSGCDLVPSDPDVLSDSVSADLGHPGGGAVTAGRVAFSMQTIGEYDEPGIVELKCSKGISAVSVTGERARITATRLQDFTSEVLAQPVP